MIDLTCLSHVRGIGSNRMWDGNDRRDLGQLLVSSNKQRIRNLPISWVARKTVLLIRNFAPRDHASDALKVWNAMRCVLWFLSPLHVPDALLIAEEVRMLDMASDPQRADLTTILARIEAERKAAAAAAREEAAPAAAGLFA